MVSIRTNFASDIYSLAEEMSQIEQNGDQRNLRASSLLEKSMYFYLQGGEDYLNFVSDIATNLYHEYSEWYKENILMPFFDNPAERPMANDYSFDKYFRGLNKNAFEEMQKMIMFLMEEKSHEIIESMAGKDDTEEIGYETRNFVIPAYTIMVASLEGENYLSRLEDLFENHQIEGEKITEMRKSIENLRISGLAEEILTFKKTSSII